MEGSKNDLKWFGQGFDGFPRTLPEDCVEYFVYAVDSTLGDFAVREKLREVQNAASLLIKRHLKGYIWQRESFQLKLERDESRSFLHGLTNFGDSIEDEWLTVYLLREISQQFPQIWIQITDADGQFLLIEAANSLPLWLNPEIADFRVWLNSGRLLIIPMDNPGGKVQRLQSEPDTLSLAAALEKISQFPEKLIHSKKIQDEAFYRLEKYPAKISNNLHCALIKVPRNLAYILHENPAYISPAIEAFYLRDPIALRPLQSHDISKLVFAPTDLVTMSTKFTKVGFAQLIGQRWSAPASWRLASAARADARAKQHAEWGMKVSCGFEMLMSDPQKKDKKEVREITMLLEDINTGEVQLPDDETIRGWGMAEDNRDWLDINFQDFENELNGKGSRDVNKGGFGDQGTQDHLRKLVSRFGDLLKEENSSAEQADFLDDMDHDDDSSEITDDESSGDEGNNAAGGAYKEGNDENEFTEMMREMLGMPKEVMEEMIGKANRPSSTISATNTTRSGILNQKAHVPRSQGLTKEDIIRAMDETEEELRDAGALDLESDSGPSQIRSDDAARVRDLGDGEGTDQHVP